MRSKKALCIKSFLCIIIVCSVVLSVFQIIRVNTQFPPTSIISTKLGEYLEFDNLNVKATTFEMIPYKSISNNNELKSLVNQIEDGEVNLIKTSIMIENDTDNTIEFPLYDVIFQSNSWANAINLDTFKYFNNNRSLLIEIMPSESIELILPCLIHQIQFSNEDWRGVQNKKFQLVFSLYPQKKQRIIHRQEELMHICWELQSMYIPLEEFLAL